MAVVEYGTVAIVPKGEYSGEIQYDVGNLVSYNGSSYTARIKPPVGTLPTNKSYWQTSAQGAGKATANDLGVVKPDNETIGVESDGTLKSILTSELLPVTDTNGLLGQPNAVTNSQTMIDAITDKIINKLVTDDALTAKLANYVTKSMMSGIQVNSGDKVPTSALAYAMQQSITQNTEGITQLYGDIKNVAGEGLSTSILEKALSLNSPGLYTYMLTGASYQGNDLPRSSYAYGSAAIYWRGSTSITVVLYGGSAASPLAINRRDGDKWAGWETYARNSDLGTFGFPNATEVADLHAIKNSGFFTYSYTASNNPVPDRGGIGLCIYKSDKWQVIFVVPYAQIDIYMQKIDISNNTWSNWHYIATRELEF